MAFLDRHKPLTFFILNQNQYLSDIIDGLYWKKEYYDFYTIVWQNKQGILSRAAAFED